MNNCIRIRGARQNNLKGLNVDIPRNQLVVVTGLSGAGKSSLVYDTIFAEAQRLFLESISLSAQQFLEQMPRPDVDYIEGLSPALAVRQSLSRGSSRSTLGTLSEVYDLLRVLYAQLGHLYCHAQGSRIAKQSPQEVARMLLLRKPGARLIFSAPLQMPRLRQRQSWLREIQLQGFTRIRLDEQLLEIEEVAPEVLASSERCALIVDRVVLKEQSLQRMEEAVALCYRLSQGEAEVEITSGDGSSERAAFSETLSCARCGFQADTITPAHFSFNSTLGACEYCQGTGQFLDEQVLPEAGRCYAEHSEDTAHCLVCQGTRLSQLARLARLGNLPLLEAIRSPVGELIERVESLELDAHQAAIAEPLVKELLKRLELLNSFGLGGLSLNHPSVHLSTGEFQRVQIAKQLHSGLSGVLYIFDEPSSGLSGRELATLIAALRDLVERGNSVLVVEHDLELMSAADYLIELGPGAGGQGGNLIAVGTPAALRKGDSLSGKYLRGEIPLVRTPNLRPSKTLLKLPQVYPQFGAAFANPEPAIPLQALTVLRGASGVGKTRFLKELLLPALRAGDRAVLGVQAKKIQTVIDFSEGLGSAGTRSTPITLVGAFDAVRELFASLPEARARGWEASRFSFNVREGRCEFCNGSGVVELGEGLLLELQASCPLCGGDRFSPTTNEIRFKGNSISDVLRMSVQEGVSLFSAIPAVARRLTALTEIGLGYLRLGQPGSSLSGGEVQRIRLAAELSKKTRGHAFYVFDEPSAGLHAADVALFLELCDRLVEQGHSVLIAEHMPEIIASADLVLELVAAGTPQ